MAFANLKCIINDSLKSSNCNGNLINELHPDINVRLNSVNVIVGKQSSGKTVAALEEIIKLSRMRKSGEAFNLLVYVTKNGDENDRTFQALKHLIGIPYITTSEAQAEETISTIVAAKNLYYQIRREHIESKVNREQQRDMFDVLHVKDYANEFLHTLVLFDDISNSKLFKDGSSYFSQLIRKCRHINFSFFLLIQGWKGLMPHVKNEITTLIIFPSFSPRQVQYIYSQAASNLSSREFQELYTELTSLKTSDPDSHPYMVVQVTDGGETTIHQ